MCQIFVCFLLQLSQRTISGSLLKYLSKLQVLLESFRGGIILLLMLLIIKLEFILATNFISYISIKIDYPLVASFALVGVILFLIGIRENLFLCLYLTNRLLFLRLMKKQQFEQIQLSCWEILQAI